MVMLHPDEVQLVCPVKQGMHILVEMFLIAPCATICLAMSFWQPIASRVTMQPETSNIRNSAGIAVISFVFSSTLY